MSTEELLKRLSAVAAEWPLSSVVWHRADSQRGVLVEYCVDATGCVMLSVCFSAGGSWAKCTPGELSAAPVPKGGEGDEWKEGSV